MDHMQNEEPHVSEPETPTPVPETEEAETRKVFGLPAHVFQGGAFGFAIGLILCGVIGTILQRDFTSYLLIFACMAVGAWLAKVIVARKK